MNPNSTIKQLVKASGLRRRHIASVRMCCERAAIATLPHSAHKSRSRILCYHSVGTPEWGVNDVRPERFRRHIELALADGYRFVPADEIARNADDDGKRLAITFDDGIRSVVTNAAPILGAYGIPWTLFVVSGWADGEHSFGDGLMLGWREIEDAAKAGATIGSHSVTHPNFGLLEPDIAAHELEASRETIRSWIGLNTTEFAIPFGQSKNWTTAAAAAATAAGYSTVYAQSDRRRSAGTVPRTFITRFDGDRIFRSALAGAFDSWEEWL